MAGTALAYKIGQFDEATLGRTIKIWNVQLDRHHDAVFSSQYARIIEWAQANSNYGDGAGESFAYGIFHKDEKHADAICEVNYHKSGRKWLKLLDLHLSPDLDAAFFEQTIDLHRISSLFSAAVVGVVELTGNDHPAKTVKLYARSGTLLAFFRGLGAYIEQQGNSGRLKVSIEGRWLVFRAK